MEPYHPVDLDLPRNAKMASRSHAIRCGTGCPGGSLLSILSDNVLSLLQLQNQRESAVGAA